MFLFAALAPLVEHVFRKDGVPGSSPGGGSEFCYSLAVNPMEKGPDGIRRPLNSPEAPTASPSISHRKTLKARDIPNEIVDPNLNPEERLLAKEKEENEIRDEKKRLAEELMLEDAHYSSEER